MATTDATTGNSRIFISYRREDSDIWVGRLADELRKHFPAQRIFVDIASIDPGADFVTALEQALASAAAMLVVIGPRWLSATDRQGRKRLDSPSDFVRQEIAESLRRAGVRVFPLLVNGADMPADEDLAEPLKPLARRQAFELTVRHWANDVAQFVVVLKGVPGLSDSGASEGAEATAQLRAEQEAQRREAERAAKEEAQLAAAKEARRSSDEETRRKEADAHRSPEGEAQRRAAEEAVPPGAESSHAPQPVLRKVVAIGGIIGVTALAVFFIGRSPDAPVASVTSPASSSPIALPAPKPVRDETTKSPVAGAQNQAEYDKQKASVGGKEYRVRHILVETQSDAVGIIEQLKKGAKFEELAKKSMDIGSVANGGDLGWEAPDAYVKPFAEAILKLKKGEVTEAPVQTPFGWHVIRLDDVRDIQSGVQTGRDQAESSSAARISTSANVLSANALYREFQNNPVDAGKRYVGKAVALEGLRGEMILMSDGVQAAVHIVDRSRPNALVLMFSDRNRLKGINQGQRFRFKCMVRKYEYSIVWMDDCSIDH